MVTGLVEVGNQGDDLDDLEKGLGIGDAVKLLFASTSISGSGECGGLSTSSSGDVERDRWLSEHHVVRFSTSSLPQLLGVSDVILHLLVMLLLWQSSSSSDSMHFASTRRFTPNLMTSERKRKKWGSVR